jgi:hypothetical protein
MKALMIAFVAITAAASAAQAGQTDGCTTLSVHGIWDCR